MSFGDKIVPEGIACNVCQALCARITGLGVGVLRQADDAIEIPADSAAETALLLCVDCWRAAMRTAENSISDGDARLSQAVRIVDLARTVAATMVRLAAEGR